MDPLVVAVLAGLGAVALYAVACRVWPFASCLRCGGSGKHASTGMPFFVIGAAIAFLGVATELPPVVLLGLAVAGGGLLVRGGSWRTCRRCKGSGKRLRVGRRLFNSTSSAASNR